MKNITLFTFLLLIMGILLVSCGDGEGDNPQLSKINFLIDEEAETQAALYDDFQPQDYNEEAPAHDQRAETLLGSTVEFKNTSEPTDKIKKTEWFVYPFQSEPELTPTAEGISFTHTFDRPGNFEIMMQTNGKNKIKIVRVVTEYLNEFGEVVTVDPSQIETPEENTIEDDDGDGIPNDEDDCVDAHGPAATKGCPDSDGDGIPDIKDNCPDEKGIASNSGCPEKKEVVPVADSDNDGIADSRDNCPDEAGTVKAKGCPDDDNDGIANANDDCPNEKGKGAYNGCPPPDADGDGITDDKDRCPDEKGTARANGCPDNDNDGIVNSDDKCPDEKGSSQYDGCPPPDRDGDGIADSSDNCPDEKGTLRTRGCPDSDDDGIVNSQDSCPNEKGTTATKGCPDSDGDGVADKDDKCPNKAARGMADGCPDDSQKDSDKDGFVDKVDNCPGQIGTVNGCPDRDRDGIADKDDKCPDKKGKAADNGCPPPPPPPPIVDNTTTKSGTSTGTTSNLSSNTSSSTSGSSTSSSAWYPTNGPTIAGVPYTRCAASHDESNWESNKTSITLQPKAQALLHSARVYASTSGKVQLKLQSPTESAQTNVSVNRGSTNLPLDDLDIVLKPGSTYTLSITPLKVGGNVVQLDNIQNCNPSPKSTPQMAVQYDGKIVLFNLKYEH